MGKTIQTDKIKIRFAKKSELPEVNRIRKQVHKLHAEGRPDVFRKKFGRKLAEHVYEFFGGEMSKIVVAKKDGKIVGFALIEVIHKPRSPYNKSRIYLKVTELGVDKKRKRQGIGRALIFARGSYSMAAWAASYFINAIPGIALHLILVPAVIYALQRSRLIPERF